MDLLHQAAFWLVVGLLALSAIPTHAAEANGLHIPVEKEINFSRTFIAPDTGSMRPTIWDGDTLRLWAPTVRPWIYDREHLLGKIVSRLNFCGIPTLAAAHRVIAITPRGAITQGDNNLYPDPGFMACDGSDYGGEITVEFHNPHPGKQRMHSWQRL